jgi:cysteine desulfurase/selenocysteine lyase
MGAAIEYLNELGRDEITAYENDLMEYAVERLSALNEINIYGLAPKRCGAISFNLENIHPYDAGMILDKLGIAVRTGTQCAEPVMRHYGITAAIRASFALYNTREEIDELIVGLQKAQMMLSGRK